jgi:Flp pilus assembly protein TadG
MRAPEPLRQLKVDDVPGGPARAHGDAGAALVEFALVAPLLLMLIFGIYTVALGYNAKVELTGGAREGARAVALASDKTKWTAAQVQARADAAVQNATPGISPAPKVKVTDCLDPANKDATVVVTHKFTIVLLFLPKRTVDITAKGVMRCGA